MPWLNESKPSWFRKFCCDVLKSGPVPNHVAFVMDGNRRFARKKHLKAIIDGHLAGFEKLTETLEWCRDLGITEVTVYAFSIENFKRSEEEVSSLMALAVEKFRELLKEKDVFEKNGICVRFFGNLTLLPLEVQKLAAEVQLLTNDYNKAFFNVCIAYTSQDEMTRAIRELTTAVRDGLLEPNDITSNALSRCLDSRRSPDPDIVIRTSGEERLSDFLLYQSAYSCLYFDNVLWPEYSFWNMCWAILHYQRHCEALTKLKPQLRSKAIEQCNPVDHLDSAEVADVEDNNSKTKDSSSEERLQAFFATMENRRLEQLRTILVKT